MIGQSLTIGQYVHAVGVLAFVLTRVWFAIKARLYYMHGSFISSDTCFVHSN